MLPEIFLALVCMGIVGGVLIGIGLRHKPKKSPEIARSLPLK